MLIVLFWIRLLLLCRKVEGRSKEVKRRGKKGEGRRGTSRERGEGREKAEGSRLLELSCDVVVL